MAKDVDEIVVGANGSVYVAPIGSAVPADIATALGADWVDLGYLSEDGVKATDSKTIEQIKGWQSFYALRRIVTERNLALAFTLIQFSREQFQLGFGGGEVVALTTPDTGYRFDPPDPADIDERMMAVEWADGDKNYRIIVPRGLVTSNVEINIARNKATELPITFDLIGGGTGAPWNVYTDDPAFAPAA